LGRRFWRKEAQDGSETVRGEKLFVKPVHLLIEEFPLSEVKWSEVKWSE
jgi:hypothetical protein